eukprot:8848149-Alexandrium_andersonii.AAC.1
MEIPSIHLLLRLIRCLYCSQVAGGVRDGGEEGLELWVPQDVVAASSAQPPAQVSSLLLNLLEGFGAFGQAVGSSDGPKATVALSSQIQNSQHLPSKVHLSWLRALVLQRGVAGSCFG